MYWFFGSSGQRLQHYIIVILKRGITHFSILSYNLPVFPFAKLAQKIKLQKNLPIAFLIFLKFLAQQTKLIFVCLTTPLFQQGIINILDAYGITSSSSYYTKIHLNTLSPKLLSLTAFNFITASKFLFNKVITCNLLFNCRRQQRNHDTLCTKQQQDRPKRASADRCWL